MSINKALLKNIKANLLNMKNFYFTIPNEQQYAIASLPRAGYNWLHAVINSATCMKHNIPGEIFVDDMLYRSYVKNSAPLDYRSINFGKGSPAFWHTNKAFFNIPAIRKNKLKYIILSRNPREQVTSYLRHSLNTNQEEVPKRLDEISEFEFYNQKYNLIKRFNDFNNSWSEFSTNNKENVICLDFKDYMQKQFEFIKLVSTYFDLDFTDEEIHKALNYCSKDKFMNKLSDKSIRINKKEIEVSEKVLNHISAQCMNSYNKFCKNLYKI